VSEEEKGERERMTGDPTEGSLAIVCTLLVAIAAKYFLKNSVLPFTTLMLLFGIVLGIFSQSGDCVARSDFNASSSNMSNVVDCTESSMQIRKSCMEIPYCDFQHTFLSSESNMFVSSVDVWSDIDPHLIMYTFVPTLIYSSSSTLNVHVFLKSSAQILVLAGPGVMLSTLLLAVGVKYLQPESYNWSWWSAATLGSMLSATDPVAVVSLLKEVGAPSNLGIIIEGESLLNDGSGFALFLICFEALKGDAKDIPNATLEFIRLAAGGITLGLLAGWLMLQSLQRMQDGILETILTLVFSYGTFILAEQVHVSGVLAVVMLGLQFSRSGKPLLSDEKMTHHFQHLIEFIANVVIFMLVGLHVAAVSKAFLTGKTFQEDLIFMVGIYVMINFVRLVTTTILSPLFWWSGYGVRIPELMCIIWSGLRGAISLTIASMVAQTAAQDFDCDMVFASECDADAQMKISQFSGRMLFLCAGVTFLTLIINATTTKTLVKFMKLGLQTRASKYSFDEACRRLVRKNESKLGDLAKDPFFEHMDMKLVWDLLPIFNSELLRERFKTGKINAARYRMIDDSPFFKMLREKYTLKSDSKKKFDQKQKRNFAKDSYFKRFIINDGTCVCVYVCVCFLIYCFYSHSCATCAGTVSASSLCNWPWNWCKNRKLDSTAASATLFTQSTRVCLFYLPSLSLSLSHTHTHTCNRWI